MNIYPDCDMIRWQVQCSSYIQNAENYYTKKEVDGLIDSATTSGNCCITPEEVDGKISSYTYSQQEIDEKIPSLSGYATEQWVENKGYINQIKTINNESLIGEGNITISGDCDLSDYVTFEDMAEYVGDVYTKTEVNNLFVTKATFNTYITNLQQQINSLIETVSGCCGSTGETEYRWIVVPNDYTCSGTTKMTKEKQQSSTDGINWSDTGQYRTGSTVLEYDSVDCGYAPSSNFKVRVNYKKGATVGSGQVECNTSTTVSRDEVKNEITFPTYFTSVEFGSCIDTIGENAFINGLNITSVTIPSNIETIGTGAFKDVGNGTSVTSFTITINEGVKTIGSQAFFGCENYSSLTIPNSVETVGGQAFYMNNIQTLVIGSGVTSIGAGAFQKSSGYTPYNSITCLATVPPTLADYSDVFYDGHSCPIYVPSQSVQDYKSVWSIYADRIQPIQ